MIKQGNNNIDSFYFGISKVDKIYKGNVKVYPDDIVNWDGALVLEYQITSNYASYRLISLPLNDTGNSGYIDWGDGTIEQSLLRQPKHTYTTMGTYRVKIVGKCEHISYQIAPTQNYSREQLNRVVSWGDGSMGVKSMFMAFYGCNNLVEIATDNYNTFRNIETVERAFDGCLNLTTIPSFNADNIVNTNAVFYRCSGLINFGGFQNIQTTFDISDSPNLKIDSLLNCINGLADMTGQSEQYLKLGSNFNKLTDEQKAIATAKNWVITS